MCHYPSPPYHVIFVMPMDEKSFPRNFAIKHIQPQLDSLQKVALEVFKGQLSIDDSSIDSLKAIAGADVSQDIAEVVKVLATLPDMKTMLTQVAACRMEHC